MLTADLDRFNDLFNKYKVSEDDAKTLIAPLVARNAIYELVLPGESDTTQMELMLNKITTICTRSINY